jgi:hypothetical protein
VWASRAPRRMASSRVMASGGSTGPLGMTVMNEPQWQKGET